MSFFKKSFWDWIKLLFVIIIFWTSFFFWTELLYIGETTALILSAVLLIAILLKSNPNIIKYIQKIKIGDFEVELNKEIKEKSLNLILPKKETIDVREKLDLRHLLKEIKEIKTLVREDIVLVVDIKDGNYISLPMLYLYMYSYHYLANLKALLFKTTYPKKKKKLLGIVSAEKAFQIMDKKYPKYRVIAESFLPAIIIEGVELGDLELAYETLSAKHGKDVLSNSIFLELFSEHLDTRKIEYPITTKTYPLILEIIKSESEFVVFVKNGDLKSIVPLSSITKIIAKDYLNQILQR